MTAVLYIHGKGGSAAEAERYKALFPDCAVTGLDYQTFTPREVGAEIRAAVEALRAGHDCVILIANSIGAYFSMHAGVDALVQRAYFISPIVDMEALILGILRQVDASEAELARRGALPTPFGETLSWNYLCYVRTHPVRLTMPTEILYASNDCMTAPETIRSFAERYGAGLTVMQGGEHWFHTPAQLRFLDEWMKRCENAIQKETKTNAIPVK